MSTNGVVNSVLATAANVKAQTSGKRTSPYAGVLAAENYGSVFNSFASGTIEGISNKFGMQSRRLVRSVRARFPIRRHLRLFSLQRASKGYRPLERAVWRAIVTVQ